jgi:hypothetical protein
MSRTALAAAASSISFGVNTSELVTARVGLAPLLDPGLKEAPDDARRAIGKSGGQASHAGTMGDGGRHRQTEIRPSDTATTANLQVNSCRIAACTTWSRPDNFMRGPNAESFTLRLGARCSIAATIDAASRPREGPMQSLDKFVPCAAAVAALIGLPLSGWATTVAPSSLRVPAQLTCFDLPTPISYSAQRGLANITWVTRLERGPYVSEYEDAGGTYFRAPPGGLSGARPDLMDKPAGMLTHMNYDGGIWIPRDPTVPPHRYVYFSTESVQPVVNCPGNLGDSLV